MTHLKHRPIPPRIQWQLEQQGLHPLLARLYAARGIKTRSELESPDGEFIFRATRPDAKPWFPGMNGRIAYGDDTVIQITNRDGSEENIVVPASNPWQMEVEAMEACLLDGAAPVVPLSLSREFLKSALAVYESARTGKPVTLTP